MSHPYQLRSMDNQIERTEGLSVADAARSHAPPELAGRDSDVETSSSFSDENVVEGQPLWRPVLYLPTPHSSSQYSNQQPSHQFLRRPRPTAWPALQVLQ